MRVLKKGREQAGWANEFDCTGLGHGGGGCGATLLVEQGDLYQTEETRCGDEYSYQSPVPTFRCCQCGVQTNPKSIPYEIAKNLRPRNT